MLTFVVPLKSKKVSQSWEQVCKLFERCIRSICNQTINDFHVITVCNEKPNINFTHPNLTYLQVEFPPVPEIDRPELKGTKKEKITAGLTDKGRKVLAGLVQAQQFNPTHTLLVDADDCVSHRLAAFVKKSPDCPGWVFDQGYKYLEGDRYLYLKRNKFYTISGTCNILRYDLNNLPASPDYDRGYGYYKFYLDHQKVYPNLLAQGIQLQQLPFIGAVYILGTGENMSSNEDTLLFNWINRKRLTDELRAEFSLYNL